MLQAAVEIFVEVLQLLDMRMPNLDARLAQLSESILDHTETGGEIRLQEVPVVPGGATGLEH